jgi:ribonucleoside-diphosphate reductase alpha chain
MVNRAFCFFTGEFMASFASKMSSVPPSHASAEQELFPGIRPQAAESAMRVKKRNGSYEPVHVEKIIRAVQRCAAGLVQVDPMRIAIKTIGGLYDGSTTRELDQLSIQTAASLISEEPEYSRLAARLLANFIDKEVANQNIYSFSQSIELGHRFGLVSQSTYRFVTENARKLNSCLEERNTDLFEYFGLRTVYDRYLLKSPESRDVIETPQHFFLRVACGLSQNVQEAIEF